MRIQALNTEFRRAQKDRSLDGVLSAFDLSVAAMAWAIDCARSALHGGGIGGGGTSGHCADADRSRRRKAVPAGASTSSRRRRGTTPA